jgi:ketosteroid isomerase-like protein
VPESRYLGGAVGTHEQSVEMIETESRAEERDGRRLGDTWPSMSQENVEGFRRVIDAYNRGDMDALVAELDPEVEWHGVVLPRFIGEAAPFHGHEGVREMFRDIDEAFVDLQFTVDEVQDLGDKLFATGTWRARGRESGAESSSAIAWVAEVENGKARRVRAFFDVDAAREAALLPQLSE